MSRRGDHYQYWNYETWHANPNLTDPKNPYYEKYYYPDDPYINEWICGELVWASYLHQEIDLGSVKEPDPDFNDETFFHAGWYTIKDNENVTLVTPQYDYK